MEEFIRTLLDNYIYLAGVAVFLILALIGYIVDTIKTDKLKKQLLNQNENDAVIPVANFNSGATVNNVDSSVSNVVNQTTTSNSETTNNMSTENQSVVPPVSLNSVENIKK